MLTLTNLSLLLFSIGKAYNTMELRQAKKASKKMPKRSSKDKAIDDRRKSGMKQKGFSIKGAGIV